MSNANSTTRRFRFDRIRGASNAALAAAAALLVASCQSLPKLYTRNDGGASIPDDARRVVVFEPTVHWIDVRSGESVAAPASGKGPLAARFRETVARELAEAGFEVVAAEPDDARAAQACTPFLSLATAPVRRESAPVFDAERCDLACAISAELKVGSSGAWDPNTGRVLPGTNSALLRAALFDAGGGRLWCSQAFARDLPALDTVDYFVDGLMQSLPRHP